MDILPTSTPAEYATPKQLEAIRALAGNQGLMKGIGSNIIHMPTQGLAEITKALMGGYMLHDAGMQEAAANKKFAEASHPEAPGEPLPGGPTSPMTAPKPAAKRAFTPEETAAALAGGSPTPQEGGAPATPGGGTPFGSGGGSLFGNLPGWAPGEKPIGWDEGEYDSRVPNSKKLNFSGEPSVQAITNALQGGGGTGGGPSVAAGGGGGLIQPGNFLPPNLTPSRPRYTREQAIAAASQPWQNQGTLDEVRHGYLGQNQPQMLPVAGGNIMIPGSGIGQQAYKPDLQKFTMKAGDTEITNYPGIINPDLSVKFSPQQGGSPLGGGGPAPPPPTGALPFAAEPGDGGAPFPGASPPVKLAQGPNPLPMGLPPIMGDMQRWSQENAIEKMRRERENQMKLDVEKRRLESPIDIHNKKMEELNKTQIDAGEKDFSSIRDKAEVAYREMPTFEMAKRVIEDPAFVSGWAADPILTVKRALNQITGVQGKMSDPYAMELFRKLTASVNLDNLKTLLGGLGQIRVFEGDLVKNATANIENTPAANRVLLHLGLKANQRAVERADLAAEYRQEHGYLDSNWGKFERNYFKDKPWLPQEDIANFRKLLEADPRYVPKFRNGEEIPVEKRGSARYTPGRIPTAPVITPAVPPPPPGFQ